MSLKVVPKYIINLDLPPEKRWISLIKKYKTQLLETYHKMNDQLEQIAGSYSLWTVEKIISLYGDSPLYYHELKSIADELDIPVEKIILLQLCYECFSACTSIILDDKDKLYNPIHIRTMDWDDTFLKPLTINVKFVSQGNMLFEGTTWVGYIGILTGVKPNVASVSINYRRTKDGSIWDNILNTMKLYFPIGYLVRECLCTCDTYKSFKEDLENTIIIAPCYVVLTGVYSGSGVVIVRDRKRYDTYPIGNKKYICQTNIDPKDLHMDDGTNILMSIERNYLALEKCKTLLDSLNNTPETNIIIPEGIIKYFLKYPIVNHETIYANVMSPIGLDENSYINATWTVD